jgi:hypothetical protein
VKVHGFVLISLINLITQGQDPWNFNANDSFQALLPANVCSS